MKSAFRLANGNSAHSLLLFSFHRLLFSSNLAFEASLCCFLEPWDVCQAVLMKEKPWEGAGFTWTSTGYHSAKPGRIQGCFVSHVSLGKWSPISAFLICLESLGSLLTSPSGITQFGDHLTSKILRILEPVQNRGQLTLFGRWSYFFNFHLTWLDFITWTT